ncbi:hypothetical protein CABS01_15518 [Colletotrichum abscissum]|uniref:Uncharacterized protein n=1 Tax=Colletotrichum abscissum TaxID=1671311 RepID=A0A9P9X7U4_9PEZI|nr:uncharacterized protein CABS01_15518 [Colletotrichum abscissum]KAI3539252.1 hypothetical protein CABS02_11480 [Colletotrichum abscissum]KAK1475949.1 hypothetical protein CABS01_15518 [Colletotrichum abscissum]
MPSFCCSICCLCCFSPRHRQARHQIDRAAVASQVTIPNLPSSCMVAVPACLPGPE